jgi:site-specific recombinase XerD
MDDLKKRGKNSLITASTFRDYAEPFFLWDKCPHIRRLLDERKSITARHAKNQRRWLERYVFSDSMTRKTFSEITRADLIDFRSRLLGKIPRKINTVNRVMAVIKTIFKEAMYREDIEKDPTFGLGNIKEERRSPGIFSLQELQMLFPKESLGPWQGIQDYTCFLLAASTGMRRGEILALCWENVHLDGGYVNVEQSIRIAPDDLVLCYADGSRLGNTWWKKRFSTAMDKAAIDRKARNLSPHSFRHTLNTILIDAGKDPAKVRSVLGWRHEKTQENYTHFDIEHFKDLRVD